MSPLYQKHFVVSLYGIIEAKYQRVVSKVNFDLASVYSDYLMLHHSLAPYIRNC